MKTARLALGVFVFVAVFGSVTMAQAQRTFVSGLGNDGNPCTRTAPCRTFNQAISQTNAGGEVVVLDSSGYGAFVIGGSVSIVSPPGIYAGISVFSGDGIVVNAGSSDKVLLRGLTINWQGGDMGVNFAAGGVLEIEDCAISGFPSGIGILDAAPDSKMVVRRTVLRNNLDGVVVSPGTGTAQASFDQLSISGSPSVGLGVQDGAKATIRNSVVSGCCVGLGASGVSGNAELNIENCQVTGCTCSGISAGAGSGAGTVLVRFSDCTVTDNATGVNNAAQTSIVLSRGNNTVEGNTVNTSGTIGSYTAK